MTREEIISKVRAFICSDLLHDPAYPLAEDEALITGGLIDSMSLVRLGVFLEDAFQVYIPDTDMVVENMDSLGQITDRVLEELGG